MKKLAVFASGNGSNFQAIADAAKSGFLKAEICLLVCDRPGALVIERAEKEGVPVFAFYPKKYGSKAEFEADMIEKLQEAGVEWIALAGYMRLIGPTLLGAYGGRIINIHPSLLPAFPGKDAIGQAAASGVKVTGVTVHFVDAGMDTGPIIDQQAIIIDDGDTEEDIARKIHCIEHELYPATLNRLLNKAGKAAD